MGEFDNQFICISCGSAQVGKNPYKDPFIQGGQGGPGASLIAPCKYCNIPEAPIWMADLSFCPMGDLGVGDEVMGIQVGGKNGNGMAHNSFVASTVLGVAHHKAVVVRAIMTSGKEIVCTPNHYWWNYTQKLSDSAVDKHWVTLTPGTQISFVVDPYTKQIDSFEAGYLAGIYDGEGSGIRIAQSETVNPDVCFSIERSFKELDIAYTKSSGHNGPGMVDYTFTGGWRGYYDVLRKINPSKRHMEKYVLGANRLRLADTVERVVPYRIDNKEVDVVDITTTTGNYVAWGYASKNCAGVVIHVEEGTADQAKESYWKKLGLPPPT